LWPRTGTEDGRRHAIAGGLLVVYLIVWVILVALNIAFGGGGA
jgi:hypothetical protein